MGKFYWILGDDDAGPIGPYKSNSEAIEARRGLRRFYRYENEPGFVTSDKRIKGEDYV